MPSLLSRLLGFPRRRATTTRLLELDDRLLRDIGVTRTDLYLMAAGDRRSRIARDHE